MVQLSGNTRVFTYGTRLCLNKRMTPLDALNKAIELSGGKVGGFAAKIGVGQSVVSNWRARMAESPVDKVVPAEYCPAIERVTRRAVRCEELNPSVDWAVLRRPRAKAAA